MHIEAGDKGAKWLEAHGGWKTTAGWIRGDGGQPSRYTVARHFLYLWRTRAERGSPGKRFLVEGNMSDEILFELRTQTGLSPVVIETLLALVEYSQSAPGANIKGLAVIDGRIFVLPKQIVDFHRDKSLSRKELTTSIVSNILKTLAPGNVKNPVKGRLPGREDMGIREWREVDPLMLMQVAESEGHVCNVLRIIIEKSKKIADRV